MRNSSLHATLEAFTADAGGQLAAATAGGAEIPFELVEEPGATSPLYCYRPLTGTFIRDRGDMLASLPTYAPAARALTGLEGVEAYLRQRGEVRVPTEPRQRADQALRTFLAAVFAERSEFGFEPRRFEAAYAELETALYEGRAVTTVLAPLLGVALDHATTELVLGDGLSLVCGDGFPDAPPEAVWGESEEPNVLAVLRVTQDRASRPPISTARVRFRRLLTALRLFERGGYSIGPIGWARTDQGAWRPVPLSSSGRPRLVTFITADQEDEFRAFCSLIARRVPSSGELAWALSRFEMGCERLAPFEALSDYLLALRALLEPEGPGSGRLSGRLAAICATAEERASLAERVARTISLETAVIAGLAPPEQGGDALVDELAEHLRAVLRDALCGHLTPDLKGLADELLAEAAGVGVRG